MSKRSLTDRSIKALKPAPAGKRYEVLDAIVPGFGVRVTDKVDDKGRPRRTFILVARYPGSSNPARRSLGDCGEITLSDARDKARKWREMIAAGKDPQDEMPRQREAEAVKRDNTFGAVIEEYLRRHVKGQRKAKDVEREIRNEMVPVWQHKPVTEITRRDVVNLIEAIADRPAPYQAHNVFGHVRTFFNWAINRGTYGLETSPCDRLKPASLIGAKEPRQRVLSDEELRAFWNSAGKLGYPFGPMLRLLALTGQRKSEVSDARWREFDLERKLWTVPPERFKSNASQLVPLTNEALAILGALPRFDRGDYLFTTTFGRVPVSGFSKAKARLDKLMAEELGKAPPAWVIHDLRRATRTQLASLRVPDAVAEMVIGHGRKGLQRVYDQHTYEPEMRDALERWANPAARHRRAGARKRLEDAGEGIAVVRKKNDEQPDPRIENAKAMLRDQRPQSAGA